VKPGMGATAEVVGTTVQVAVGGGAGPAGHHDGVGVIVIATGRSTDIHLRQNHQQVQL
jgi:hypothetical protein